jgi:Predicted nucleotide-binding protein containing TIR-like domain
LVYSVHRDAELVQSLGSQLNAAIHLLMPADQPGWHGSWRDQLDVTVREADAALVVLGRDFDASQASYGGLMYEIGYLVGRLGRDRVALLVEAGGRLSAELAGLQYFGFQPASPDAQALSSRLERWLEHMPT